jgi:signal transduction histidine kinase
MRSSSEGPIAGAASPAETALLEKIEELSFLRALNDRLADAGDFASACRALVELVWEEYRADTVAYVSLDAARGLWRLEALAPERAAGAEPVEFALDAAPFPALRAASEPMVLDAPAWLAGAGTADRQGVFVSAPTQVRGATTGLLIAFYAGGAVATLEEDRRVLALVATAAALALDAARSQAREEFLATLRHDINNPVNVALGYTEMIMDRLRAVGDRETLALSASVRESLRVVADLVSNYLHMAAIDRGVPVLVPETLDLHALAAEVVARFRLSAAEQRLALACEGEAALVWADRRQLGRVITNLVSNAVKYTPGPGRVDVRVAADTDGTCLTVADTGYGIAADDLPAVCGKYARFHRDREIPGTGLGLYISRAIVAAHTGTLTVASTPGHGSTFTVRLPRRDA